MPLVMIRDGKKMRLEMETGAGQSAVISNGETGETFILVNAGGQMMALRGNTSGVADPAESWSAEIAASATRTGSCAVAGENGGEWTQSEGGVARTVCVTADGIILKSAEGGQTQWETTSLQRGPQGAELFTLPPGVQVMNMGNMAGMLDEAMGRAGGQ